MLRNLIWHRVKAGLETSGMGSGYSFLRTVDNVTAELMSLTLADIDAAIEDAINEVKTQPSPGD